MIIRESPLSKESRPEQSWPPRSPHEALLSSPLRQRRLQQVQRYSTSPTPSKRRRLNAVEDVSGEGTRLSDKGEDEDEDEETLKLQLKAIEARLKLKKLQNAKKRQDRPLGRTQDHVRNRQQDDVEVPHSPKPQPVAQQVPPSPRRVVLGIDKGLKATDISLRKIKPTSVNGHKRDDVVVPAKPKSFSERIADVRNQDHQRREKQQKVESRRSGGFGLTTSVPSTATVRNTQASETIKKSFSKEPNSNLQANGRPSKLSGHGESRSDVAKKTVPSGIEEHHTQFTLSRRICDETSLAKALSGKTLVSIPQLLKDVTSPEYDLPDFPTEDFVVTGIIASKSTPHDIASTTEDASFDKKPRPKFMAITLTDLEWSLDLYLFDTGFTQFWKLTVGTVIAILNPGIMPPKPHLRDTGRFSLKLSSSEDTVIEIGMAQDLGFCTSMKKNGKECGQWIDNRKTEFCDFHVNLAIEKTSQVRMEINCMSSMGLFGEGNTDGKGKSTSRGGKGVGPWGRGRASKGGDKPSKSEGQYYDRQLRETAFLVPPELSGNRSAARLLDGEDYLQGGLSSKERSRKRLADRERERELGLKLAKAGSGLGVAYIKAKGRGKGVEAGDFQSVSSDADPKKDAAALGLIGVSAAEISLSPTKAGRRKANEGAQPMGWGGAFKRDLLQPKASSERLGPAALAQTSQPLVPKARVVLPDEDDGLDIV